ncbi:MAG: hypothetical protein A3I12_01210 [Gammaproteobacteria bacterium RIFCSPLOWO2_02_FULL_38_11]|nr:MAG: hypothetical protein A3I12_01210 [Gammaproteobacteria bacterium RIFCSPLOWO2_02_FULL_38_11]
MLTIAQRDCLKGFVGCELVTIQEKIHYDWGIYLDSVKSYDGVDLGTKILYLEKSITQGCQTFLNTLDKLYKPELMGAAKEANLDFIRSLKTINDLFFNNKVKYGIYGVRDALTHFFSSLGPFNPQDFKDEIQKMIHRGIEVLSQNHQEEIIARKRKREEEEKTIANQSNWRNELDLPSDQRRNSARLVGAQTRLSFIDTAFLAELLRQHNSITTISLSAEDDRLSSLIPSGFFYNRIIMDSELSLTILRRNILEHDERRQHRHAYAAVIGELIRVAGLTVFSLNQAFELTTRQYFQYLNNLNSTEIRELIVAEQLTLERAQRLTPEQFHNLRCSPGVRELIISNQLSLEQALSLTLQQGSNLNTTVVRELMTAGRLSLEQVLVLTARQSDNLSTLAVQELMTAGRLSLEQALSLTSEQGISLNTLAVQQLMTAGRLSLEQALALTTRQRLEITLGNPDAVLAELTQQPQATSSSYRPSF